MVLGALGVLGVLGVLAVAASCGRPDTRPPPAPTPTPTAIVIDAASAPPIDGAPATLITGATTQLITAIVPDWTSTTAELRLWQRAGDGWRLVRGPWPGVVGKAGTAWGIGVHGSGAPAGRAGPVKREGDAKSPAGVFAIRKAYGYSDRAPSAAVPYQQVDDNWKCVDDPASAAYTAIVDRRAVTSTWTSAEDMRRKDALYRWVVDLAHNPEATPGSGSCIFLHVWGGPRSVTVGCTAMDEGELAALLAELSAEAQPRFVLLPRAEYAALAPAWGLPVE
jgi:D-alanyl-D-alanine dipeptidase